MSFLSFILRLLKNVVYKLKVLIVNQIVNQQYKPYCHVKNTCDLTFPPQEQNIELSHDRIIMKL